MGLRSETLHAGTLVTARHVCCRPHDHACGEAEVGRSDSLVFPLRGVFVKHLQDGREVVAHAGQAVFFNRGEVYRVSHPLGGDDCFVIEPSERLLREILQVHDPRAAERTAFPFRASHALLPASALLQQRLLWRSLREARTRIEIEERVLEFAAAALDHAITPRRVRMRPSTQRRRREQVRATAVLLASDSTRRWTLDELALHAHGSPFHLARAFRDEQGISIHQYLLHVRLARALDAVLDSAALLTTIALETGFATPSHFTAAFRSRYGVAPSRLRRNTCAETARKLRRISTAKHGFHR